MMLNVKNIYPWIAALGIAKKVMLIFYAYALILLLVFFIPAYIVGRNLLTQTTLSKLQTTMSEKQFSYEEWLSIGKESITQIGSSAYLQTDLSRLLMAQEDHAQAEAARERLKQSLDQWTGKGKLFRSLLLIENSSSLVLVSTNPEEVGTYQGDEPYFIGGSQRLWDTNYLYSAGLNEPAITVSHLIPTEDGQISAILVGFLDFSHINAILNYGSELYKTRDVFLVNQNHLYVTKPLFLPESIVFKQLIHTEAVNRCLRGQTGSLFASDYRGVPALINYKWMEDEKLCMVVKIDQAEALQTIYSFTTGFLISLGISILAGTLISLMVAKAVTNPIQPLLNGVERFTLGQFSYRIPGSSRDEIGALTRSINEMAEGLEKSLQADRALYETQQRLGAIFNGVSIGVVVINREYRIVEANPAVLAMFGYSQEEFLGKDVGDVLLPAELPDMLEDYKALLSGQRSQSPVSERRFIRKNGEIFWCRRVASVLQEREESARFVVGMVEDITSEKLAQASQERMTAIIEATPDITFMSDSAGNLLYSNEAARLMIGELPAEDASPLNLVDVSPDWSYRILQNEGIPRAVARGNWSGELALRKQDGTEVPVSQVIVAHYNPDHQVSTLSFIARDISYTKKIEVSLRELNDHLELTVEQRTQALRQSQETLRAMLDAIPEITYLVDCEGNFLQANQTLTSLLHASHDQLVGTNIADWFPPAVAEIRHQYIHQVIATRQAVQFEDIRSGRNLDNRLYPVFNDFNEVERLVILGIDITERKRIENALRESELRFQLLVDSMDDIVYTLDREQRNTGVFGRWLEHSEINAGAFLGKSAVDILGPEAAVVHKNANELALTGQRVVYDWSVPAENGDQYYQISLSPLINENGEVTGLVGVGRDITPIMQVKEDLARSNGELERFAYIASHDLQEPLRMVTSYLQLLERRYSQNLDATALEFIDYAVDGASRMRTLINDLLTYSRVGTKGKEFSDTDLNLVLDRACQNLKIAIEESAAKITSDPLPRLKVDDTQIEQLFQNLIENAIKFRGEDPPQIHVNVRNENAFWLISVRDNGIGVDPRYQDRIFILFQRLHTRDKYPGTGIGLAVSKRIVERHGGQIWVESNPDKGATFLFTLPVARKID